MQENRSFDHYFGTLAGVRGFADANALRLPDGGQRVPAARRGARRRATSSRSTSTPGPRAPRTSRRLATPGRCSTTRGTAAGWTAGWPPTAAPTARTRPTSMGYHTRADMPLQFALAEAFTVCDAWHARCSARRGPTACMWMTGTVDPEGRGGGPCLDNARSGAAATAGPPTPSGCTRAGVSWRVYQQDDDVRLQRAGAVRGVPHGRAGSRRCAGRRPRRAARSRVRDDAMTDRLPDRLLGHPHERASPSTRPTCRRRRRLRRRARSTRSRRTRTCGQDGVDPQLRRERRPLRPRRAADPAAGHPGRVRHLDVAGRTPGTACRSAAASGCPCIVISPWTAGGWVCSEPFDHTSALRFLERSPGWRSRTSRRGGAETFGDLTSAFRFGDDPAPAPRTVRPAPEAIPPSVNAWATSPAARLPSPRLPGARTSAPDPGNGHPAARSERIIELWFENARRSGVAAVVARRAGGRRGRRHELGRGAWVDIAPGWCAAPTSCSPAAGRDAVARPRRVRMYDRVVPSRGSPTAGRSPRRRPDLAAMARELSARYGVEFTQVGANLYRDGADSVAWHGDRVARELPSAVVALVSLGAMPAVPAAARPAAAPSRRRSPPRPGRSARDGRLVPAHLAAQRAQGPRRRAADQRAVPPRLRGR